MSEAEGSVHARSSIETVGATSTSRNPPLAHAHTLRTGRISQTGNVYLITNCTHARKPLFADPAAGQIVLASIRHLHGSARVESHACVVMPDHLHWLLTLRQGTLAEIMRSLKTFTAKQLQAHGASAPVWQDGFHDHALRSEESLINTANYLLANPLRAGLVDRLQDYPLIDCQWGTEA